MDRPPDPANLSRVISTPVPGGVHVLMTTGTPDDDSLYQYFLDDAGHHPLDDLAGKFGAALTRGETLGAGLFRGGIPPDLTCRATTHTDHHIDMVLVDGDGAEKFMLTSYRRAWPTDTSELEMLSDLIGPHAPELVGRIEVEVHGHRYTLGTIRRIPTGITGHDMSASRIRAQYFSHEDSLAVGRTIRYVHDSLLMAFPYRWVPAQAIGRRLEERLAGFVSREPALAEHAPWIRDSYRSLTGEMLIQRIHGNLTAKHIWLEDGRCVVGGWEGDVRLPRRERIPMGSPFHDLATLQSTTFSACGYDVPWLKKVMTSFFEGYGEPMLTLPMSLFILDTTCWDAATPGHRDGNLGEFLAWFRENIVPVFDQMEPSVFHRPA
ncbi:hypothetical protein [Corynebacterium comes]|uniref:hypothetical protein n=1 Tax=Corynebacterium comes TaxID=2675218 RepID=UPI0012E1078D|nr:hypothetical protein [Corynebacterium comes]